LIKVLITGANSFVGTNVEKWLLREPEKYYVETLDMKNPNWNEFDFSKFDVVFHVAGIAHVSNKKSLETLYYKVNRDLTIETAKKSKESGIKQFIFMSSMIVYNSKETRVSLETKPNPDNFYGLSKLQAEEGLQTIEDEVFKVCILRPPMIYGPNSKGNFSKLVNFARKTFIFPNYQNKRSMLFIDNLSNSIKYLIDKQLTGIFFPQNNEYVNTADVVKKSALILKKRVHFTRLLNWVIHSLKNHIGIINKMFGDFYYDLEMSKTIIQNNIIDFDQSLAVILDHGANNE